ncbi:hypothetical protein QCA50_014194 [Cerrena zonata]|uniref:Uncharacterized protein n=1 Tax=Cerrena zonata TaxID=2478898 RepID=A0AAW0G190_9APHY
MSGLSLQAKRWRTIMVTVPIIGATSLVLYQRLVLGKPQRKLPQRDDAEGIKRKVIELKPEDTTSNTGHRE